MSIGELSPHPANAAQHTRALPVIILAYAGSGADRLQSLLSAFPGLACTTGTGIIPLCDQAMTSWQVVDRRSAGGFSPLALASVRTFSAGLMTAILAREDGARWCELTSATPAAATTFAHLYPQARFLTVYRQVGAVVRAILEANRWGLAGPEIAPFVSAHPASTVAALTHYWATRTAQHLEFEQAHPRTCRRVRAEDLAADAAQAMLDIGDFLVLNGKGMSPSFTQDELSSWHAKEDRPDAGLPLNQVSASLLARVNELHRKLGYPPLAPGNP